MREITPEAYSRGKLHWEEDPGITVLDLEHEQIPYGFVSEILDQVCAHTGEILDQDRFPFLVRGEHLTMLGAFRAVIRKFPDVRILDLDARPDLREEFLTQSLSHACLMRRCWELTGDDRIFQLGIRAGGREEYRWAGRHVNIYRPGFGSLPRVLDKLRGFPVYLTLDMDVLDPTAFPGAEIPENNGVSLAQLQEALDLICSRTHIVGCDVCELGDSCDPTGVSDRVAREVVSDMLQDLYESRVKISSGNPL